MQLDAATLNPLGATAVGGVERLAGQAGAAQNVESLREAALEGAVTRLRPGHGIVSRSCPPSSRRRVFSFTVFCAPEFMCRCVTCPHATLRR